MPSGEAFFRRLSTISAGLIHPAQLSKTTKDAQVAPTSPNIVRFVHHTVRDFLLGESFFEKTSKSPSHDSMFVSHKHHKRIVIAHSHYKWVQLCMTVLDFTSLDEEPNRRIQACPTGSLSPRIRNRCIRRHGSGRHY